jgi:hypothetical protein
VPAHIKIIHSKEFLKATPEGKLDLEESKKLLVEIALASGPLADCDIILDTRKAQSGLSATDLWYLAAELGKHREVYSRKAAILCPLERFDQAEFFALCAHNRGFRVSAFTTFGEAMEWLIGPDD